jgi:hypothetical protein
MLGQSIKEFVAHDDRDRCMWDFMTKRGVCRFGRWRNVFAAL